MTHLRGSPLCPEIWLTHGAHLLVQVYDSLTRAHISQSRVMTHLRDSPFSPVSNECPSVGIKGEKLKSISTIYRTSETQYLYTLIIVVLLFWSYTNACPSTRVILLALRSQRISCPVLRIRIRRLVGSENSHQKVEESQKHGDMITMCLSTIHHLPSCRFSRPERNSDDITGPRIIKCNIGYHCSNKLL